MMHVRIVSKSEINVIEKIVDIHMSTFAGFFLTFMGRGFLNQMYSSYCNHENSGLLVALEGEDPVGFLAYSGDMSGLYKHMLKTRFIQFAWYSLGAFLRKPKAFMKIIRAFLKPGESKREEAYVEISSIGVKPETKSKGIGSKLISILKESVDFSKYEYINLETDAENNEAANKFYLKNGFVISRSYETHEGRKMNEYRFKGEIHEPVVS